MFEKYPLIVSRYEELSEAICPAGHHCGHGALSGVPEGTGGAGGAGDGVAVVPVALAPP